MVITKKIIVPSGQKEEDLELTVEAEANQYIPFALDEVNLDFQILGPAPNNPDEVEILIAASRKEKVEDRVAIAEAAGLKPRVMDVESYATQEAFRLIAPSLPANGRDQNIALVDIGAHVTHFYVLRNDQFLFSRDQAFGGNQLTHDIQRAFNLSPEEAESAKKNQGLPENYDTDVLQPFMETLALEVTRALQFFFTSTSYSQVDQIVLSGGGALLPGLDELVAKRAGVATVVANPFATMAASDSIRPRQLAQDAPLLLIATRPRHAELRMIRINLLPHREQKRQARQRQFVSLAIGLAVLGLARGRAGPRDLRRADREPAKPQQAAQGRDRQARRADQGNRQAPRADAGVALAQAGRRDAADQSHRGRASARPDGAAAARRHLFAQRSSRPGPRSRSSATRSRTRACPR